MVLLCFSLQPISVFFTMFCFIAIPQIHNFIYHIIFLCFYTHYTYLSVFLLSTTYSPDMYMYIYTCEKSYFQSCFLTSDVGSFLAIQKLLQSWNALQSYY